MSSYGPKTSFGVGMIHGIGAETGTQVLLIAAVGGAASAGLGIPMLFAFVIGLLMSNFAIVVLTSVGFVASQTRERIYVAVGLVAGLFSLVLGMIFVLSAWTGSSRRWTRSCRSSRRLTWWPTSVAGTVSARASSAARNR